MAEPLYKQKIAMVEFIKANPGADSAAVGRHVGAKTPATRCRLTTLARHGHLRMESVPSCQSGGLKAVWFHVKDLDLPEYVRRKPSGVRLDARRDDDNYDPSKLPAIFALMQPPRPVRPRNARVTTNDSSDHAPLVNNSAQGSGRASSWRNSNGPVMNLIMRR